MATGITYSAAKYDWRWEPFEICFRWCIDGQQDSPMQEGWFVLPSGAHCASEALPPVIYHVSQAGEDVVSWSQGSCIPRYRLSHPACAGVPTSVRQARSFRLRGLLQGTATGRVGKESYLLLRRAKLDVGCRCLCCGWSRANSGISGPALLHLQRDHDRPLQLHSFRAHRGRTSIHHGNPDDSPQEDIPRPLSHALVEVCRSNNMSTGE